MRSGAAKPLHLITSLNARSKIVLGTAEFKIRTNPTITVSLNF